MKRILMIILLTLVIGCDSVDTAWAGQSPSNISDETAVRCILGEAQGEYAKHGYNAFLSIADALRNRNRTQGVYGCTANIDNDIPYLKAKGYFDHALRAWKESEKVDLVSGASHWESTDFKRPEWSKNMEIVYKIGKHVFYK